MDSDSEFEESKLWRGVPGTIILINAIGNTKYNNFPIAHVATCRLIKQYLRLSNSQNLSVCIYGLEVPTTSAFDSRSVVEIFPLSTPTLEDYKKLRNFDISTYTEEKELKLSEVLWQCSKIFANFKKQLTSRTIVMLTQLQTPPIAADHKPTLKKVMDLVDSNIDVKVVNVFSEDYKIDPFYENFLLEVNKGQDFKMPLPMWDSKEIEKILYQESHRHLAVAKLDFEIGNGLSIGVGIYSLLKRCGYTQQKKTNLDRDTNAIVTSVTKTMKFSLSNEEENSAEENVPKEVPLLKSEILHYQEYGGEKVEFTDKEFKAIKNPFGPPMLKLLGFKPIGIMCKEKWYFKKSYFLFPNENSIEGSTKAFKALHKACNDMGVVAFCVMCTRLNAKPVIVALSPTTRPLGLDVELGFDVIIVPFIENVRDVSNNEDDEIVEVDEASKFVMNDIIKTMRFDYKPDMFENPKTQSEYRALESIALEDETVDSFIDTTIPDPKIYKDIKEDLFTEVFGTFGALSIKRSAGNESGSSKRARMDNIDENLLKDKINSRTVNSYTVQQLRDILKFKDNKEIPALNGLKKAELVDLVYKYCA